MDLFYTGGSMIGKGILSSDDQLEFGKLVDRLSKLCYVVMYLPRNDEVLVTYHELNDEAVKEILKERKIISYKAHGSLRFVKFKWR